MLGRVLRTVFHAIYCLGAFTLALVVVIAPHVWIPLAAQRELREAEALRQRRTLVSDDLHLVDVGD
jgi:hypothetical protein